MKIPCTRFVVVSALVVLLAGFATPWPATAQDDAPEAPAEPAIERVTLESPGAPQVVVHLFFDVGSIHDPEGKEGLAALTAFVVGQAGTQERSYKELVDALYPMAADLDVSVEREATVISGEVHRDTLDEYTKLLTEVILQPGFSESDFRRNREQLLSYLTTTLRATNDELLGLEAIQAEVFEGHPYAHPAAGTVEGLESLTLDDVKKFYRQHYTRANLRLGVAGGYPEGYVEKLVRALSKLPAGEEGRKKLPEPKKVKGRNFTLIEKDTGSVGLHFGYPLPINRSDADYYPLMVANSFLGEHRTHHGQLMQELRGERGLNYGDYSYIEYWENPPFTSNPSPNVPRRDQYFSVWLRPVRPETAHFALRAALFEVDQLLENGLTKEEFELTRTFLINYSKLWAQTLSDRLGFMLDSRFYGMDYYIDEIEEQLEGLTVEDVNRVLRKYIRTDDYEAVLVTDDAAAVKAYLQADKPSPITYQSQVAEEVLKDDEVIVQRKVEPTTFEIVPVSEMFQK